MRSRSALWFFFAVIVTVAGFYAALHPVTKKPLSGVPEHLKRPLGYSVTAGAAAGYIADQACGTCHEDLYTSYQAVGMARSLSRPREEVFIENFEAEPYLHVPSQRYYEIRRRDERLIFRRYQLDEKSRPINLFEREIDWILGSGNKARSYLYQTDAGELFQLPIGWYTEIGEWRMSPGFDRKDHDGVQRPVRRECMFCHNGYPSVPAESDRPWQPHLFPKDLPEGTGCQRCHGPGAAHVRAVLRGDADLEEIRAAIVNPSRLSAERRDSVCFQCHLLPSVELIGVRRFDRADYSFRPGELLSDYIVHVDIDNPQIPREERFEINHHGYRLRQSACFQKSEGALSCITCHDPHRKVPREESSRHYGSICLSCHGTNSIEAHTPSLKPGEANDCVSCHMPQRRTQDVVHVVMTDHKIQRHSGGADLLAPLEEMEPIIEEIDFLMPEQSPSGALGETYRAVTMLRAITTPDIVRYLERQLALAQPEESAPYFDLARGQIILKKFDAAEQTLRQLLERHPNHARALQWLGVSAMVQGDLDSAEVLFTRASKEAADSSEPQYNLGLLRVTQEQYEAAAIHFSSAVHTRPNLMMGWFYLGEVSTRLGRLTEAIGHYRRALEIDPSHTRSYIGMARALSENGETEEALRFLRHGRRVAARPEPIDEALAAFEERE